MRIYIPKGSKSGVYYYDFELGGDRHHKSTGETTKREAERVAKARHDEAADRLKHSKRVENAGRDITVGEAFDRYWRDKERDYAELSRQDILNQLAWIAEQLGPRIRLGAIGDREIAKLVSVRRDMFVMRHGKATTKKVANGTVNRTTTQLLKRVMNREATVHKTPLQTIDWSQHTLSEPQERVRFLKGDEEPQLLDRLDRGYEAITRFTNMIGLRRNEAIGLRWRDVDDVGAHIATITVHGKGGTVYTLPLLGEALDIVRGERGNHPEFVFSYVAAQTRRLSNGVTQVTGERYPITKFSLRKAFEKAKHEAGIVNYRWHDGRHTAATRLLKATGNLKIVQRQLRHARFDTTAKYAHVDIDDLALAMGNLYPSNTIVTETPQETPQNVVPFAVKR